MPLVYNEPCFFSIRIIITRLPVIVQFAQRGIKIKLNMIYSTRDKKSSERVSEMISKVE